MIKDDGALPISLQAYRKGLHDADVAVITASVTTASYRQIDRDFRPQVRSLTPILYDPSPPKLRVAHQAFTDLLQDYRVWCVLIDVNYPGWVSGTLLQVALAMQSVRILLIWGWPTFQMTELVTSATPRS